MQKTKATARALRESIGMTQLELAAEFDVEVRTVKRWGEPSAPEQLPRRGVSMARRSPLRYGFPRCWLGSGHCGGQARARRSALLSHTG